MEEGGQKGSRERNWLSYYIIRYSLFSCEQHTIERERETMTEEEFSQEECAKFTRVEKSFRGNACKKVDKGKKKLAHISEYLFTNICPPPFPMSTVNNYSVVQLSSNFSPNKNSGHLKSKMSNNNNHHHFFSSGHWEMQLLGSYQGFLTHIEAKGTLPKQEV